MLSPTIDAAALRAQAEALLARAETLNDEELAAGLTIMRLAWHGLHNGSAARNELASAILARDDTLIAARRVARAALSRGVAARPGQRADLDEVTLQIDPRDGDLVTEWAWLQHAQFRDNQRTRKTKARSAALRKGGGA